MAGMNPQATPPADARLQGLKDWLQRVGLEYHALAPASADASFRRYFRIETDAGSFIVMDAPPEQEDCRPFVRVSALLTALGLHVPEVLRQDLAQGYLLLTDLGTDMYLPALNDATVDRLYGDAMAALLRLQGHGPADLPPYDQALLLQEMALFRDWYLQRHLGLELDAAAGRIIDQAFTVLAEAARQQPVVIVHRDYHSRNLMISRPNPGILDFQDAVNGPLTYDLVSLLRDCYIAWPRARVEAWVAEYHRQLLDAGIVRDVGAEQFLRWFDWMGIQRHLKASGIFARLNYRDGKAGYLKDIPRTLAYVSEVGADYPELREFVSLLTEWQGPASGTRDEGRGTRGVS
jgi:aminoglycoside/choline kinase family phosphotransferase